MSNIIKIIVIGAGAATASLVIYKVVKGANSANTADKLAYDIQSGKIKEVKYLAGVVPKSLVQTINLQLKNPTSNELTIKNLALTVSIPDSKGGYTHIASIAQPSETTIKPNANSTLSLDAEMPFIDMIKVLPNFIDYAINRMKGIKATQKILVSGTVDSMGFTVPLNKVITI